MRLDVPGARALRGRVGKERDAVGVMARPTAPPARSFVTDTHQRAPRELSTAAAVAYVIEKNVPMRAG